MFKKIKKIFIITSVFCLFLSFASAQEQLKKSFSYDNEALGVKIIAPSGWYIIPADRMEEVFVKGRYDSLNFKSIQETTQRTGALVVFFHPSFNSTITLTARPNTEQQDVKTSLDVANTYMKNKGSLGKDATIIEDPAVINIGNKTGAHFTFKRAESKNINGPEMVYSTYIFMKDNIVFGLVLKYQEGNPDNYTGALEYALNSLVIK